MAMAINTLDYCAGVFPSHLPLFTDRLFLDHDLLDNLVPFHRYLTPFNLDLFLYPPRLEHLFPLGGFAEPIHPQVAVATLPPHRQADCLPEPDEQPVYFPPLVPRQPRLQCAARVFRVLRLVPTPEVRDPVDVHVDADAFGAVPRRGEAEMGHLGADPGERREALDGVGDVAFPLIP